MKRFSVLAVALLSVPFATIILGTGRSEWYHLVAASMGETQLTVQTTSCTAEVQLILTTVADSLASMMNVDIDPAKATLKDLRVILQSEGSSEKTSFRNVTSVGWFKSFADPVYQFDWCKRNPTHPLPPDVYHVSAEFILKDSGASVAASDQPYFIQLRRGTPHFPGTLSGIRLGESVATLAQHAKRLDGKLDLSNHLLRFGQNYKLQWEEENGTIVGLSSQRGEYRIGG